MKEYSGLIGSIIVSIIGGIIFYMFLTNQGDTIQRYKNECMERKCKTSTNVRYYIIRTGECLCIEK